MTTNKDSAEADRLYQERHRNLETLRTNVMARFGESHPLAGFLIFQHRDIDFRVYVFFKRDRDLRRCFKTGFAKEIEDFVYGQLEFFGFGKRDKIKVEFEIDTHKEGMEKLHKAKNSVPTDEDFLRAERLDRQRWLYLDEIAAMVIDHFAVKCPLVNFHLMPGQESEFGAYVFFEKNEDIPQCSKSGVTKAIENFVYEQLEFFGRGKRGEIKVVFEVDSDENVNAKFHGNYYNRLL